LNPAAGLVQGSDGNFYGTTSGGGVSSFGTVFRMVPAGAVTTLYSFSYDGSDGSYPYAALVQGAYGNFYGTTVVGGTPYGGGTVFKLTVNLADAPTGLSATGGNDSITLRWKASSGASSYNVYESTTPGGEDSLPVQTGITSTYATIRGLTNGSTYYFKVAAVNANGTGPLSSEVSKVAGQIPTVSLTLKPSYVASGTSVTLTWKSSHATACTASGAWSGGKPLSGQTSFAAGFAGQYRYTLSCTGIAGTTTRTATLRVH
jgi:uncharacterized repeat protein (TIGR03803 family)